jgi:hypothetical protein
MTLHSRFRLPGMWRRYVDQLEDGAVYRPMMHRGEIKEIWTKTWVERPVSWTDPRGTLAFFRSLTMGRTPPRDQPTLFD